MKTRSASWQANKSSILLVLLLPVWYGSLFLQGALEKTESHRTLSIWYTHHAYSLRSWLKAWGTQTLNMMIHLRNEAWHESVVVIHVTHWIVFSYIANENNQGFFFVTWILSFVESEALLNVAIMAWRCYSSADQRDSVRWLGNLAGSVYKCYMDTNAVAYVVFEQQYCTRCIWRTSVGTLYLKGTHDVSQALHKSFFFSVSLWFSKHVILVRVIYPGWDVSSSQGIMYTKIHTPIHIEGKFRFTNPPTGRFFCFFLGEHWRKQRKSTWRLEELCTNISQNIFPSLNLLAHVTRCEFMIL